MRYVPDVVKAEFVNIGVILRDTSADGNVMVRFTRDWSRVRCLDSGADLSLMQNFEWELAERLQDGTREPGWKLELLEDTFSNSVQITPAVGCLAESMPTELDQLMRIYVDPLKAKGERKRTGKATITSIMRREFERAGVWGSMRKSIAASVYTRPGDSMKIDCGYRPNGLIRMFQAISLDGDGEAAKVLAYSAPRLSEGVQRVEGAGLELTAVIEPLRSLSAAESPDGESWERYHFGVELMEREKIRVITTTDVPRAAETAKRELHL